MIKYSLIILSVLIHCCSNYHLLTLSISLLVDFPAVIQIWTRLCPVFRRSLRYLLILLVDTVNWKVRVFWTSMLKMKSTECHRGVNLSQILMLFIYMCLTYLDNNIIKFCSSFKTWYLLCVYHVCTKLSCTICFQ